MTKWPTPDQLPVYWNDNREALIRYISLTRQGVWGIIRDNRTGTPIPEAVVDIVGIGHHVTSKDAGDFYRLLAPGAYNLYVLCNVV